MNAAAWGTTLPVGSSESLIPESAFAIFRGASPAVSGGVEWTNIPNEGGPANRHCHGRVAAPEQGRAIRDVGAGKSDENARVCGIGRQSERVRVLLEQPGRSLTRRPIPNTMVLRFFVAEETEWALLSNPCEHSQFQAVLRRWYMDPEMERGRAPRWS